MDFKIKTVQRIGDVQVIGFYQIGPIVHMTCINQDHRTPQSEWFLDQEIHWTVFTIFKRENSSKVFIPIEIPN